MKPGKLRLAMNTRKSITAHCREFTAAKPSGQSVHGKHMTHRSTPVRFGVTLWTKLSTDSFGVWIAKWKFIGISTISTQHLNLDKSRSSRMKMKRERHLFADIALGLFDMNAEALCQALQFLQGTKKSKESGNPASDTKCAFT